MKTFFITSLPRSRSAWLANFLTYGNSYCWHDALAYCTKVDDIKTIFESAEKEVVGNADHGNALFIDALMERFPGSPIVVVERDIDEVHHSMEAVGLLNTLPVLQSIKRQLERIKKTYPCLVVDFNNLPREAAGREIWRHCVGSGFDVTRFCMLDDFNIQVKPSLFPHRIAMLTPNILKLASSPECQLKGAE